METHIISGNAKVVRNINRAMILNLIRTQQPISRSNIAKITGLNKSTVSSIVADLLNEEIIYEQVKTDQNIGRNPVDLYLRLGRYLVGAINIDIVITRFAIVDIDGKVLGTSLIDTEPQDREAFIGKCINELNNLCAKLGVPRLEGVGISVAGIVDSKNLIVNFAPNLGWQDYNIGEDVKKFWPDIRILSVGNDAKSSALAELWFGDHEVSLSNFVFVSIGPGIGSGIVVDGKVLDGASHASGEFGHMVIYEGGEYCNCGNYGCWERYASDRAIARKFGDRKYGDDPARPAKLLVDDVIESALSKDQIALDVLAETGYYLGLGLTNVIRSIDPHVIIIGGKITQVWDIVYPKIIEVVKQRAFFGKERIAILPSSLHIRPRLLGAATLAIKEIFDDYKIIL